jgi:RES domain-containing protein
MLVYRITHKKYSDHLFAPGIAGRWNGSGKKVLYCAESIPLAFLESMIRRQGVGFNHDYNIVIIEMSEDMLIHEISLPELADGWRSFRDYSICQKIGNAWFDKFDSPVLKAPSAMVVQSFNYVINTQHSEYKRIKIVGVTELTPDIRIDELLKNYKG